MKRLLLRVFRVLFGLLVFAFGSYLGIQANVGLGAWEAFSVGVSRHTGLSYGDVTVLTGLVILVLDVLLGEPIGLATILNTLLIGKMVDLFNGLNLVLRLNHFAGGVALLFAGQVIMCLGVYLYVGAGLGAGPRDSLMVALGKRLTRTPIGLVRGLIEGTALCIGWLLGAKVGVGTLMAVFGIGFILQGTFRLLRFDIKAVRHESAWQSLRALARGVQKAA